jgi:hypothetical protein
VEYLKQRQRAAKERYMHAAQLAWDNGGTEEVPQCLEDLDDWHLPAKDHRGKNHNIDVGLFAEELYYAIKGNSTYVLLLYLEAVAVPQYGAVRLAYMALAVHKSYHGQPCPLIQRH